MRVGDQFSGPRCFSPPPQPMMPGPGEVFYLPPEPGDDSHKGDRPHVLVSLYGSDTEVVTLAYGSTRPTDALRGAEHVLVDPSSAAEQRTGLIYPTYVY